MADTIGVSKMSLSRYERDINEPDVDTLNNIASYFDVTVDYLLNRSTIREHKPAIGNIINVPVYKSFISKEISEANWSTSVVASQYDYISNPNSLIGLKIGWLYSSNYYVPHFMNGDILIIELTNDYTLDSAFYLTLNKHNDIPNTILSKVSNSNEIYFAPVSLQPGPIIYPPNEITILGRVLTVIRQF